MYEFIISPDGRSVHHVYSDDLEVMFRDSRKTTRRASRVEPAPAGGWAADLSPVGGPILGPFRLRHQALNAELDWLSETALGVEERRR